MTNHTPGPWEAFKTNDSNYYLVGPKPRKADGTINAPMGVGTVVSLHQTMWPEYAQDNAQLIAAAPEMLECIQEALRQLNTLDFSLSTNWNASVKENAIQLLEHAVKKAIGE